MHRTLTGSATGALLVLACLLPAAASAVSPAAPPSVFVRVEGSGATLLPQTAVQSTAATTVKGHPCPGSSAGSALELATRGNWSGKWYASFHDYLVGSILGETPTAPYSWTLWVNGRSQSKGGCGTPLAPSDHVLWFDCQADVNFNCTNAPLALSGPAVARRGAGVTVSVAKLDGFGHSSPLAGAAVSGDGVTGLSGADGRATVFPTKAGVITVQATKSGATPSDPVFLCVYATRSGSCGNATSGPPVHVTGIKQHAVFVHGPRELRGTAGPDPSGLTDVSLSLYRRTANGHCSYYDGVSAKWRATGCHMGALTPSFSVGASAAWSYLLPAALAVGAYRLDVVARDGNGRQTKLVPGVSQLDFSVKAMHK